MDRYHLTSLLALLVLGTTTAHADTLTTVPNGGQLILSQSWTSSAAGQSPLTVAGTGTSGAGGVGVSDLSAAGSGTFLFNQTILNPAGSFAAGDTLGGNPYGFTSSYVFNVPASVSASAFVFSLNLGSTTGLTNLTARLYAYSANGNQNLTLGGTGAVSGSVFDWTAGPGGTQVTLPEVGLPGAGEYVLEIAGLETGKGSGTFSGALDIAPSPVPLPAALPLLAGALGGLGFFGRRRRAV